MPQNVRTQTSSAIQNMARGITSRNGRWATVAYSWVAAAYMPSGNTIDQSSGSYPCRLHCISFHTNSITSSGIQNVLVAQGAP